MGFRDKLQAAVAANRSYLCVGLDPDPALMPSVPLRAFLSAIIDATKDLVCAYKPNLAFFEALGRDGFDALTALRQAIPPELPIIADGKRGDVGHSMAGYGRAL
ncbi:MAG TPA: orotidine 5'-phosphate decarboxylase / HUMPS family protein, partial [Dehalococcoidia bacterium]|nr:orotidine 5'-phosphate decarboxylase / HUMPS family protein [Dehalococcoidia bacterium]